MLLAYLPVLIMIAFVSLVAYAVLFISALLRPKNPYQRKLEPWECGLEPIGEASKGQFRIHFFIVAILFIIFDVETLFLFPWAVILDDKSIAGFLLIEMFIFIAILGIGLMYAWIKKALEWV
ncbi:MAG: NADH-quinone oxidoreductase subunit A [Desulfobacteraceae bacterium]|nr:MAG: NADH-quinone oxidoreductase subunit A [Desulfobacteraceae bacterium]